VSPESDSETSSRGTSKFKSTAVGGASASGTAVNLTIAGPCSLGTRAFTLADSIRVQFQECPTHQQRLAGAVPASTRLTTSTQAGQLPCSWPSSRSCWR
jgi:hypothetical protein